MLAPLPARTLLREVHELALSFSAPKDGDSEAGGGATGEATCPVIIAGDMNLTPISALYVGRLALSTRFAHSPRSHHNGVRP